MNFNNTLLLCTLLTTTHILAMKRKAESSNDQRPLKQQKIEDTITSYFINLPPEILNSIWIHQPATIGPLKRTCSHFNNAIINLDTIVQSKEYVRILTKDFYSCNNLLTLYADTNHEYFHRLWDNQPVTHKRIRNNFISNINMYAKCFDPVTTIQHFSKNYFTSLSSLEQQRRANVVRNEPDYNYFDQALQNNSRKKVHLCLSSPFKQQCITYRHPLRIQTPLIYACLCPTTKMLQFLLHKGIDTCSEINGPNIFVELFRSNKHIPRLVKKIDILLKHHAQQYPNNKTIINKGHTYGCTPLMLTLSAYRSTTISLKNLLKIISLFLQYGTDPHVKVGELTAFTVIEGWEEEDIIKECLQTPYTT